MILARRTVVGLGFGFCIALFLTARSLSKSWHTVPQSVGLGDLVGSPGANTSTWSNVTVDGDKTLYAPRPNFVPGIPKPPGSNYSKTLVVPKTRSEDADWIAEELPDWDTAIYVPDDPKAALHPPKNKGHEVMIYLTYIIDFYHELPEVAVFMHSHRYAWHNDDIFDGDAAQILKHLSLDRVVREGYMNTRCSHGPGCPDWMHPGAFEEDESKQEEVMLARAWAELFPDEPVPSVLSQPCCAQFALSRDRIRSIPRARFVFYRDWLLRTDLSDYIAGRVWEYLWQYVFTGQPVVCPDESVCLCDGYGVCFGGPDGYRKYRDLRSERDDFRDQEQSFDFLSEGLEKASENAELDETMDLEIPQVGRKSKFDDLVAEKEKEVSDALEAAKERGKHPKNRAAEAGRPWKEGDSF
ncbi:hypothetical protein N7492_009380 [Penicillium capsulatum]|uniref:Uncharacterized protein n=1 Tax=Penicillium capsulatum TaxID=69766 RepID=A0A9W9HU07_9EURO|nr:hypothetical protein N7492_009380 [Penicillium capsulatum]KAJ6106773.1 hypothetical protein N7512_010290 [Penicillium capsulatum]